MDRRQFVSLLSTGIAGVTVSNGAPALAKAFERKPSQRPNFLFLIADDLMFRTIHALNNHEIHTPNIDKLVVRGCAFTHCFHQGSWTGAVCVASRTMLNTGLTAFHARENLRQNANETLDVPSWGETLSAAGYDTYITGKWHLDCALLQRSFKEMGPVGPGFLPSTSDMYDRPSPGNDWQPWDTSRKGHWLHTEKWPDVCSAGWADKARAVGEGDSIQHSSELYANAAIDYLKNKAAKRDAPFFMYVGFNAPHDPRQAPKEYLDLYPADRIELPPNYLSQHPFDLGFYKARDERLAPFPRTKEAVQMHRHEYYAIITHMDHHIGRILEALEASGRASNTYVILTADHGLAVGEHGLMGKNNQYDCSMRMPLLLVGPGIPAGRRIDEMVYQHSMYPTTCDLAGIAIPKTVEFPSLAPMLHGDTKSLYDAVFGWQSEFQRNVRTEKYKLIFYATVNRYQLFDLANDPWEMQDLSADPGYASVKKEMIATLKRMQHDLGDPQWSPQNRPYVVTSKPAM